ncbi:phosphodiester glycosidase family protein [Paradesulfitobacterium ferrireducens]|uniref:phosphodiester glycosidase family protein n=1 Tax=Paradesulfitobacterium ferrireducens TaxID=2816476 RepID=UPI001A8FD5E9|nr:phosphodiester glycosidase family protein [Paradesulfitobacterium ferrireducens]
MRKRKRRIKAKNLVLFLLFNVIFSILLAPFVLFYGPFQSLKVVAVGAVETSRHPQVVRFFLSQDEINTILRSNDSQGVGSNLKIGTEQVVSDDGITIEDIKGPNFKGKVMLVRDPKRVKVAVTKDLGEQGQRLTDMVKDAGAVAGVNGGGFYDPNGKGNGGFPFGLTVQNGKLVHNNVENQKASLVALDGNGKLIIKEMSASELAQNNIKEAVTFGPNLIEDGKPLVKGDGGWGWAPRTAIGQTADGTIIFVVIDGRQPTWSVGASLRDVMNIFQKYDAVNAVNLDGGSSSEMVYNGKIVNKLWNIFGERYIPTAFVVMP